MAARGELYTTVPMGFLRTRDDRCEVDPDGRIRSAIATVFDKFEELGSIRQVLLWFRGENVELPGVDYNAFGRSVVWKRRQSGGAAPPEGVAAAAVGAVRVRGRAKGGGG